MSDIVERLRANMDKYPGFENMNTEAATEIERLRVRVAELEAERGRWKAEALAWRAGTYTIHGDIQVDYHYFGSMLDNLRAARAANRENTNE